MLENVPRFAKIVIPLLTPGLVSLERFQIEPQDLLNLVHYPNRRFVRLNEFLLSSFASRLQTRIRPLLTSNSVHDSWKICLQHTILRYPFPSYHSASKSYTFHRLL